MRARLRLRGQLAPDRVGHAGEEADPEEASDRLVHRPDSRAPTARFRHGGCIAGCGLADLLVHDEGTAHPEPPPYVAASTPSVLADASSCLRAGEVFRCPKRTRRPSQLLGPPSTRKKRSHERPREDLRHDPAGRRAVAGHLARRRREARDRGAARAPRRRRHRGRLPDRQPGRLRGGGGDQQGRARFRRSRRCRAPRSRTSTGRGRRCSTPAKPRIHVFIATSAIHMKKKLRMTEEQVKEETDQGRRPCQELLRRRRVLARGRQPLRRRLPRRGVPARGEQRRHHAEHPRHRRVRRARGVRRAHPPRHRERRRRVRGVDALPQRPRPGGRQLAGRRRRRCATGGVRDQRPRRAGGQRRARRGRDGDAHALRLLRRRRTRP